MLDQGESSPVVLSVPPVGSDVVVFYARLPSGTQVQQVLCRVQLKDTISTCNVKITSISTAYVKITSIRTPYVKITSISTPNVKITSISTPYVKITSISTP